MNTDLTFIINEPRQTLKERFEVLIKDSRLFDCLVGYFYTSGFYAIYKALEKTEKIRILIGIGTTKETYNLLKAANRQEEPFLPLSHSEIKEKSAETIEREIEDSEDDQRVEEGVYKFIEWTKSKKLEIKAYPSQNIHAKLYTNFQR